MTAADELEEFQLSELEKKAQERSERLKALRAKRTLGNNTEEDGENSGPFDTMNLIRRSYQPVNAGAAEVDKEIQDAMKATSDIVEQIIDDSKNLALGDNLDVSTIAPRKVDWDLRRGIQEQLEKLERKTDKAINTLVRQKLTDEGDGNLDTKVTAMSEQKE
ncbi:Coiled-coil domain-containing protein 12 [Aphelenchoides bicaudatus]|nr:Coiled-coil domain-containing protein 12 [Aphelenchoides bicaudatus]